VKGKSPHLKEWECLCKKFLPSYRKFPTPRGTGFLATNHMEFTKSLKKNKDFQQVYKKGKSFANNYFVMYVLENELEENRLGISVSKKVGNSVQRHRLTRLIRENYRVLEGKYLRGLDIVIIARVSSKGIGYKKVESALKHLGKLHGIEGSDNS
jgi:ribonuclease P protein component